MRPPRTPFYDTRRLLVIEKDGGDYIIAADAVGAGAAERVLVLDEGNGARQVFDSKDGPVRSVVVGIVDDIFPG